MKKTILLIGTLVIASLFAGCSKDEEKNLLIGTWESNLLTEIFNGNSSPSDIKGRETLIFYADKKVEWKVKTYTDTYFFEGIYTTKGNSITLTFTNPVLGTSFVKGPGEVFEISLFSNGETAIATVTKQTFLINGDNLTLEKTAEVTFSSLGASTYIMKTTYKKVATQ